MNTDPNWLLSTTAQSAAALVAIIGGFLVSRVITLASNRAHYEHRLNVLNDQLATANKEISEREALLISLDARNFLSESVERLVNNPKISLGELARLGDPRGLSAEQLAPFVEEQRQLVATAFKALIPLLESSPDIPSSLDEVKEQNPGLRESRSSRRRFGKRSSGESDGLSETSAKGKQQSARNRQRLDNLGLIFRCL